MQATGRVLLGSEYIQFFFDANISANIGHNSVRNNISLTMNESAVSYSALYHSGV